jgi:D-3-phosphoglycerate dehydrogenase
MLNAARVGLMKKGAVVLNFAREGIVEDEAVVDALNKGKLYAYVCDFPTNLLKNHPRVVTLPHLGASTAEAEDNCAVMVADQIRDYLENGNVLNSVNFPEVVMPRGEGHRIAVVNANVPNMVGQISTAMAKANLNIIDMLNKSKGDLAYTLIDVNAPCPETVVKEIQSIKGVLAVRCL